MKTVLSIQERAKRANRICERIRAAVLAGRFRRDYYHRLHVGLWFVRGWSEDVRLLVKTMLAKQGLILKQVDADILFPFISFVMAVESGTEAVQEHRHV